MRLARSQRRTGTRRPSGGRWAGCGSTTSPTMQSSVAQPSRTSLSRAQSMPSTSVPTAIEAERELVEVVVQMRPTHPTVMGPRAASACAPAASENRGPPLCPPLPQIDGKTRVDRIFVITSPTSTATTNSATARPPFMLVATEKPFHIRATIQIVLRAIAALPRYATLTPSGG